MFCYASIFLACLAVLGVLTLWSVRFYLGLTRVVEADFPPKYTVLTALAKTEKASTFFMMLVCYGLYFLVLHQLFEKGLLGTLCQ